MSRYFSYQRIKLTKMFHGYSKYFLRTAILAIAVPAIGLSDSVDLNGATVVFNGSTGPTAFNQVITFADGDVFDVSGTYFASYNSNGTSILFQPTVTYIGTSPSVANDVISVDLIQQFFDPRPGTWDGLYTESIPVNILGAVGAGSSLSSQLSYSSTGEPTEQSVNGPSPLTGSSGVLSASANLSGLTGDFLIGDYELTFNLNAGSAPNSGISTDAAVPEPSEMLPAILSLAGVLYAACRHRRGLTPAA
jgi:hypothetical protein